MWCYSMEVVAAAVAIAVVPVTAMYTAAVTQVSAAIAVIVTNRL